MKKAGVMRQGIKLIGQHIVFIVDECHRALSAEGMQVMKGFFPNSTWFGFTGTPIFEVNKKQAKGQLARTTHDQYGEVLHTYTIKNGLDDGAVLGFQVEHEDTIEQTSLDNHIHTLLRTKEKYAHLSDDELNGVIDQMDGIEKETYIDPDSYESDEHIQKVIHKIFKPDNAYTKFDFQNGRPQKSAILTTSSIDMAKRYYKAIKEMTKDPDWLEKEFAGHPIRTGRTIEDPDFPRVAITYSLQENEENSIQNQDEMKEIIKDYNEYYHTAWSIEDLERYNGDINNRLARKKGEFKEFGKQIDLVIVVDRLLTGFDAPTIQTLFVDRNLSYANLIQAFSRTNRTFPGKTKGLIVTFRKPYTMEQNVKDATKLYSYEQEETNLVYPTYGESKKRFKKAHKAMTTLVSNPTDIDEHAPLETRIEFVKTFQELNNAYEALVTYDDYNDEMEKSKVLSEQVKTLEEYIGVYNTIKGSLIDENEGDEDGPEPDFSDIEFYGENAIKIYDIDSTYIDRLLETYSANNQNIRDEIEQALQKLDKSEIVKEVYREILNAIDSEEVSLDEDILVVKRQFFTEFRNEAIEQFANTWFVDEDDVYTILKDLFINVQKWGHEYNGQELPEGIFTLYFDKKQGKKAITNKLAFSYDCKLNTNLDGYEFSIAEKDKAIRYIKSLSDTVELSEFTDSNHLDGHIIVSNKFKEKNASNTYKSIKADISKNYDTEMIFLSNDALMSLHEQYRTNFSLIESSKDLFLNMLSDFLLASEGTIIKEEHVKFMIGKILKQASKKAIDFPELTVEMTEDLHSIFKI